jgi:hypothetical protein
LGIWTLLAGSVFRQAYSWLMIIFLQTAQLPWQTTGNYLSAIYLRVIMKNKHKQNQPQRTQHTQKTAQTPTPNSQQRTIHLFFTPTINNTETKP